METTSYHPKLGVKYLSKWNEIEVEHHMPQTISDKFNKPNPDNLPYCKEVVQKICIPFENEDGTTIYVPFTKEILVMVLEYANEIEARDPIPAMSAKHFFNSINHQFKR